MLLYRNSLFLSLLYIEQMRIRVVIILNEQARLNWVWMDSIHIVGVVGERTRAILNYEKNEYKKYEWILINIALPGPMLYVVSYSIG